MLKVNLVCILFADCAHRFWVAKMAKLFIVKPSKCEHHVFLLFAKFLKLTNVVENVNLAIF